MHTMNRKKRPKAHNHLVAVNCAIVLIEIN